jgi:hypothetical protein
MVHIMLLLDPLDVMEDVSMEKVFREGPEGNARANGR